MERTELSGLRGRYVKQYTVSGGTRQAVVYPCAVHYEDSGTWKEIDNTLVRTEGKDGYAYANTANPVRMEFAGNAGAETLVRVSHEGNVIEWGLVRHSTEPEKEAEIRNRQGGEDYPACFASEVFYGEAADGMDVRYRPEG